MPLEARAGYEEASSAQWREGLLAMSHFVVELAEARGPLGFEGVVPGPP